MELARCSSMSTGFLNNIELHDSYGILRLGSSEFLFDIEDLPIIKSRSWYCDKDGYLVCGYYFKGVRRFARFHRIIMKALPGQYVDHINKKKSDNRKSNLRICSKIENERNRGRYSNNRSGVTGVCFDKERRKWAANITYNNRKIHIGRFDSKEDAIRARLEKEVELFKEFAPQRELWISMKNLT